MTPRWLIALVFFIAILLGTVILVGLAQKSLDTTGVAVALSSMVTGLVVGQALRAKSKDGDQP